MKISKDVQGSARRLLRLCLQPDGRLDHNLVRRVSQEISQRKPRNYIALLISFCDFVRLEEKRHTAIIRSAIELTESEKIAIMAKLSAKHVGLSYQWDIEPSLLAGFTIQIADDVIDASVKSRIERLSCI